MELLVSEIPVRVLRIRSHSNTSRKDRHESLVVLFSMTMDSAKEKALR